jgi:myo-inositol catabolism protein IolC
MAMAVAMAVAFAKGRFVFANYNRSWLDEERHRIEDYEATQTVRLVPHNQTHIH